MISHRFQVGIVGALFSTMAAHVYAGEPYSVENQLKAFKENPKAFMSDQRNVQKYLQNYKVTKVDPKTEQPLEIELESEEAIDQTPEYFSQELLKGNKFIDIKNQFNEATREKVRPGRARIEANDDPVNLVDELKYSKLQDMDSLRKSSLHKSPWSDDYWPIYAGQLARRYADSSFPNSSDWSENEQYIQNAIASYANLNSSSVDYLSPAEKYDLLVGDDNMTLTKAMLADGRSYYDKYKKVEPWMGICHGWAAAAFMEERPAHDIKVMSKNGYRIRFYPSDIKALASLLWAKAAPRSRFIGTRCNLKDPATDQNGRILNQDCFDTNPGTFHKTVVNQIGVSQRSFVLDATFDYEVWNQPAFGYEYTYFNPQTGKETKRLKDAIVSKEEFTEDKFKSWRNDPRAVQFVGVNMKFTYLAETRPSTRTSDSKGKDRLVAVNYLYDLELDAEGNIIGGEWYHQKHPDFLWVPAPGAIAKSVGDQWLDTQTTSNKQDHWKNRENKPMPESWQKAAIRSSRAGQPLTRIVKELIQKANQFSFLGIRINGPDRILQ